MIISVIKPDGTLLEAKLRKGILLAG
jgi:hypothetical protein